MSPDMSMSGLPVPRACSPLGESCAVRCRRIKARRTRRGSGSTSGSRRRAASRAAAGTSPLLRAATGVTLSSEQVSVVDVHVCCPATSGRPLAAGSCQDRSGRIRACSVEQVFRGFGRRACVASAALHGRLRQGRTCRAGLMLVICCCMLSLAYPQPSFRLDADPHAALQLSGGAPAAAHRLQGGLCCLACSAFCVLCGL